MLSAEEQVREVVHTFYAKVRQDELLGPIFAQFIGDEWDAHLQKMCDFWETILFQAGKYKGNPMLAHLRVAEIGPQHFDRWLALFNETVPPICEPALAELMLERAARMRENLQNGVLQMRAIAASN